MADRLAEITSDVDDNKPLIDKEEEDTETTMHFKQYDDIKRGLDIIKKNVIEVEKLKEIDGNIANETKRKENKDKMDVVITKTNRIGGELKKQLDILQRQNKEYEKKHPGEVARIQMRNNLHQTQIRRFHQIWNEYNTAANEFKQNLQERTKRQLKIVDSNITDEEAERIVASGQANGVIKQALISENLEDVMKDIQERHMDILKLESQVLEVYELFQDLATLVDLQQESLDVIENRIEHAKEYAEKAEIELVIAEQYQKKSRKKCCCILVVLLILLVSIIAPILGSVMQNA